MSFHIFSETTSAPPSTQIGSNGTVMKAMRTGRLISNQTIGEDLRFVSVTLDPPCATAPIVVASIHGNELSTSYAELILTNG